MSAQHTPGPWWLDDDHNVAAGSGDTYKTIADPRCMEAEGNEAEIDANARLIAAAPETAAERDRLRESNAELRAALKLTPLDEHPADERGPCLCSQCAFRRAARAAIAKVEGDT